MAARALYYICELTSSQIKFEHELAQAISFSCFTGTKVQILTQKAQALEMGQDVHAPGGGGTYADVC